MLTLNKRVRWIGQYEDPISHDGEVGFFVVLQGADVNDAEYDHLEESSSLHCRLAELLSFKELSLKRRTLWKKSKIRNCTG